MQRFGFQRLLGDHLARSTRGLPGAPPGTLRQARVFYSLRGLCHA